MLFNKEIFKVTCLFICIVLLMSNEYAKVQECITVKQEQIKKINNFLSASEDYKNCIRIKKLNNECKEKEKVYRKKMNEMDNSLKLK